jgi:hypothetical protein
VLTMHMEYEDIKCSHVHVESIQKLSRTLYGKRAGLVLGLGGT